ncbi:hypothetical protein D3C73_1423630 [compost metagenome]
MRRGVADFLDNPPDLFGHAIEVEGNLAELVLALVAGPGGKVALGEAVEYPIDVADRQIDGADDDV